MKKEKGMKSATMPKDHFERNEGSLGQTSNLKYGGDFSNPQALDKNTAGLANYVKSHKAKH